MALRDRLEDLSQRTQDMSPQEMISEWVDSVGRLFSSLESMLGEYVAQKLLSINVTNITAQEEVLGSYVINELTLVSGPEKITFTPKARLVAGATGRIDVYNERHPTIGYLLLRRKLNSEEKWTINSRHMVNRLIAAIIVPASLSGTGPIESTADLNKDTLERMIELMLPQ